MNLGTRLCRLRNADGVAIVLDHEENWQALSSGPVQRFEELAFSARKENRLTPDTLGNLWIEANGRYYGDAVEIPDGYRWGWSYIPHFIHSRFYCYSYVFGQLLVLALYRMYKDEGKSFVPKYLALLEAGGSDSPEVLLKPLGVTLHKSEFWQKGFVEIKALVANLQKLI